MDLSKIEAILKKMSISEEAIKEFTSTVNEHFTTKEKALKEEFTQRLNKAKQVCVEEVESHKANLSRGVQRFLEAKVTTIEKAASKKHAIEESEATTKLKHLKALLEGINVDSAQTNQALQAAKEEKATVEKQLSESREALQREKAKAGKLSEIAEKSMIRQKDLEGKLQLVEKKLEESKATPVKEKTLAEEKQPAAKPQTVVAEEKQNAAKPAAKPAQDEPSNEIDDIAQSLES
jgi:chromosome segregation ATPase